MAYVTDNLEEAEQLIRRVIYDDSRVKALEICRWLLSFNLQEMHKIKCYQTFGKRPDIRFCIDRGADCQGIKVMTGFLVIEPDFGIKGLYCKNFDSLSYFKTDTPRRFRINSSVTSKLSMATIREHILESYLEKTKGMNLEPAVLKIEIANLDPLEVTQRSSISSAEEMLTVLKDICAKPDAT